MKKKQPRQILTEKLNEKDRQIAFLFEYVESLKSMLKSQGQMIEGQKNMIRIQEEMIALYKSCFKSGKK